MIILFYSNECEYCKKLLEYIKINNIEKHFKMLNIITLKKIPENITIVPTIINDIIKVSFEGKKAYEYVIHLKFFDHPTNNIDFWINNNIPKPNIEEDKKAIDKFNSNFASTGNNPEVYNNEYDNIKKVQSKLIIKDKKTAVLLKLRK